MQEFYYCERMDASFFAEPMNAFTNVFFIIAAYMSYKYLHKNTPNTKAKTSIYILNFILIAIGLGSFLWHTIALPWSMLADVIPITLFMYVYLFSFVYYVLQKKLYVAVLALFVFSFVNYGVESYVDKDLFNGSISYAPALISLFILALFSKNKKHLSLFLSAIFVFLLSLVFRSIDFFLCESFSFGSHFLWHICNASMLYMLLIFLMRSSVKTLKKTTSLTVI
ncbi:ceramidase domain-containing protein [Sulfurimonas sp. MAG313]|nr:ceramidase domain-containing protein [Sulfurimonas sp. MAG313]MDF1880174.1 ceramidase domain-containing protein [Sulfurimonas sp. MAG313]